MGIYRSRRGLQFLDELFSLMGAMVVAALVVSAMIGLYREDRFTYSRLTFAYWTVVATVMIALARWLVRRYQASQRSRGVGVDRAVVVGWGAAADLLVQRLRMFPDYGYRVVGILADGILEGTELAGIKVLGTSSDLARVVRNRRVNTVFMALTDVSQERLLHLMEACD